MVFLKTLERLPGQDRTRSRAAKHAAKGAKLCGEQFITSSLVGQKLPTEPSPLTNAPKSL